MSLERRVLFRTKTEMERMDSRKSHPRYFLYVLACTLVLSSFAFQVEAQGTRLLRQADISNTHVVFTYGGDVWVADINGGDARRITSTPAVEIDPHFSPDGTTIAFSSTRDGSQAVYTVPVKGGEPSRLTWYPSSDNVRGWTPDGKHILYTSTRETAPTSYSRLWTVPVEGGPSTMVPSAFGADGSYQASGKQLVVDRSVRWDEEWHDYRGGQNLPLAILDLVSLEETVIPGDKSTDTHPVWQGGRVFFLSDRDWTVNIWSYNPANGDLEQLTTFKGSDIKTLSGNGARLIYERDGNLYHFNPENRQSSQLEINVRGDFPLAEPSWEDVGSRVSSFSLSPTGKRAIMEARGDIFTVPADKGDPRNLTRSDNVHDKNPIWSPKGGEVAWFSDDGSGYVLLIGDQEGTEEPRSIELGMSKMSWEPTWSPDGEMIAFVDDDVRIRIVDVGSGSIMTIDVGEANIERGSLGLTWSPDSQWLAYAVSAPNNFQQIRVWSREYDFVRVITDPLADASRPAWDRDGKHLYFTASTDVGLGSGWANTSAMQADPEYALYVMLLQDDLESPFSPKSDEETVADEEETSDSEADETEEADENEEEGVEEEDDGVKIDFQGIERRILALPMPASSYFDLLPGPEGSVFILEFPSNGPSVLHKFTLEDAEAKEFASGVNGASVSNDGKQILLRQGSRWRIVSTGQPPSPNGDFLSVDLQMRIDRKAEWKQIFEEAWRYERDFFYDPGMHGRDWDTVRKRYEPLVPYVRHRDDLNYILDQINGELSVGHSFVFGGDYPDTESSRVGLLGANLVATNNGWQIERIFTTESWNPGLSAPLDRPGLNVEEGMYLVGVNGTQLTTDMDPYRLLDGTRGKQTVVHLNSEPSMENAWTEIVEPISSEFGLRQRAWVEDNRREVDRLSDGKIAYIWVPNTGGPGVVSFNRYFFSQQDKLGAVIDERFNGGGLLDDYMVDLMTRDVRAAITNEVPDGKPFVLPAGILGPKVLLINQLAGSGGDFFPWVFRQQNAGPLIGMTTWGGLVKSSVHYAMLDGGALTAPDNAVFDPVNNAWIAENTGVAPDITVWQDAKAVSEGRDPQLERAVQEVLRLLENNPPIEIKPPPFSRPAKE